MIDEDGRNWEALFSRQRMVSTVSVDDHTQLWNTISNHPYADNVGSTIMALGDVVMIEPGTYKAGLFANSKTLFMLDDLHGTLQCTTVLECELDGEAERRVMYVKETGGGVLRVVGLKLNNGYGGNYVGGIGGGMNIEGATVELAMCAIENNEASQVSDMLVRTSH